MSGKRTLNPLAKKKKGIIAINNPTKRRIVSEKTPFGVVSISNIKIDSLTFSCMPLGAFNFNVLSANEQARSNLDFLGSSISFGE